jgi:DNA-binding response OmpR family regulator
MRILLVEDEEGVIRFISKGLKEEAFSVDTASSAEEAEQILHNQIYDLIILDILLPQKNGFEFLHTFRQSDRETPIIILTAKDSISDKRAGFQEECDDYLTKPFHFEELLFRIRALLKRRGKTLSTPLQIGHLSLNPDTYQVTLEKEQINLTKKEFALLRYFMFHPQKALTRTQILSHVWQLSFDTGTNVVDVAINSLRKKIHREGDYPRIVTIYGVGYALQYHAQE